MQTVELSVVPIRIREEMGKVTLSAGIMAGGVLQEEFRLDYPVAVLEDNLTILEAIPPGETILTGGTSVDFSMEVDYHLLTREQGQLVLEARTSPGGQFIAGSVPLSVSRSIRPQRTRLNRPQVLIPGDDSIELRVRLMSDGAVLQEAVRIYPDPTPAPPLDLRVTGKIVGLTGDPELHRPNGEQVTLEAGMTVREGDSIVTGLDSTVTLSFRDEDIVEVKEATSVTIRELTQSEAEKRTRLWMKAGEVSVEVNPNQAPRSDYAVKTAIATASVRGTKFSVKHVAATDDAPAMSLVSVTESTVEVDPENGTLESFLLTAGQSAQITETSVTSPHGPATTGINPLSGTAGVTEITISGTNFSAIPAKNVVRFGGVAGEVLAASPTLLTVRVPRGAATGTVPLIVSVNGFMSNATDFHVISAGAGTAVSGNVSGTWTLALSPWLVTGAATVPAGETLIIEPGVVVMFAGAASGLGVKGTLVATGTSTAPIRFTSAQESKSSGDWAGIRFFPESNGTSSLLRHCIIEYAGSGTLGAGESARGAVHLEGTSPPIQFCTVQHSWGSLYVDGANPPVSGCVFFGNLGTAIFAAQVILEGSPTITHCTFQHGMRDGLAVFESSTQIENCRFLHNRSDGISLFSGFGTFAVHNSVFADNTAFAIRNTSTDVLNAQNNYWGDPSGPLDNSNADGSGLLNASGTGGTVSEFVNWTGFLTADPGGGATVPLEFFISRGPSGEVVLSWSAAATDAVLESAAALGTGPWQPAGLQTTVQGDLIRAAFFPVQPGGFFRLRRP